jgi:hypothetical protein
VRPFAFSANGLDEAVPVLVWTVADGVDAPVKVPLTTVNGTLTMGG